VRKKNADVGGSGAYSIPFDRKKSEKSRTGQKVTVSGVRSGRKEEKRRDYEREESE